MRIAVIQHAKAGDYAEYIYSLIEEKAKQHNYQIKTWSNSVPAFQQQVADDTIINIYIESNSPVILSWLYKIKIPSIIKKTRAEIVVDLNGIALPKIKIPQLIVTSQFFFNNDVKQLNGIEKYALKNFQPSINNSANVLIYSREKLNDVKTKPQLISFCAPAVFKTLEWHDKIMPKAQHADNKDYFVAVIEDNAVDDFVLLLQAFSKFKKWQQSSMQLLVLAKYEALGEEIYKKHATYKYREDVRLLEIIEEKQIASVIASAHSLIHVFNNEPHLLIISIALQCGLPIISIADNDVKEYAAGAVLFSKGKNAAALGDVIIQLYKDENLHTQLKEAAQKQAVFLNRADCENKLWELLQTAAHS